MKKLISLVFIILISIFFITGYVFAADNMKQINGNGRAILGNGITLEQAEKISLMMAKRNAVDKFGTFVESETLVKNYSVVKDEVTAISAGIVKLVPGYKKVEKKIENNNIIVKTTAKFEINVNKFQDKIKKYAEEKSSSKNIEQLVKKVKTLEKKLENISQDNNITYTEADLQLKKINQSYENLNNALLFSGKKIFNMINDKRIKRLNRIVDYLEKLKSVADPYKMITPSITAKPEIEDLGEGKIGITVNTRFKVNEQYYRQALRIAEEYKNDIYLNGGLDNISKEILTKDGVWSHPLIIVFLNSNKKIVAFYYNYNIDLETYIHHKYINRLSNSSYYSGGYNQTKGAFMGIPEFDLPWNKSEVQTKWYRELPEDIVKEITSMKVIYSKYYLSDFKKLNYQRYYVSNNLKSYIYTMTPISLSKIEYNKKDVVNILNKLIDSTKSKIKEFQQIDTKPNNEMKFDFGG